MKKKILSLILLASLPLAAHAEEAYFVTAGVPTEVQAAHDAFLEGDFKRLSLNIKRALMAYSGDESVKADMLDLFNRAYELKGDGALAPDWSAPQGFGYFGVNIKKKYAPASGRIDYRMTVSADITAGQEIEQVQLIRYPDKVIVDKQAGIGEFDTFVAGGYPGFWIAEDYHSNPNEEGLYLLNIKVKGQDLVPGWFIVTRMNASESPTMRAPALNQVVTTPNPTFQWDDFVSKEYRNFEKRKVYLSVASRLPGTKDNTWSLNHTPLTTATLGAGLDGEIGVKAIAPGDYVIHLNYRERIRFGALTVTRESDTMTPFSVKY